MNKKIFLEIEFYFIPTFWKITVGGFVNQLIKILALMSLSKRFRRIM